MKRTVILIIFVLAAHGLTAQEKKSYESSGEMLLQISSLPEAKLGYMHVFKFPVFQGGSPLTEGNNIKFNLTAEISPVSLNGIAKAVLTPIAFLEFSAGARLGTGWNVNLFGGDIYGIGFNVPDENGMSVIDGSAFDALLWKTFAGGLFQFDLAAVFPGDWNHAVMQTYHEINYHGNSRAKNGEAWYYEADDGENINGFNYYGNLLLGYQMPIFLNTIAFLMEMDLYLYDTPGRETWGDDLIRWKFANVLMFTVTEKFNIALITQFRTLRNYAKDTQDLHYQRRILDTSNPLRLEFYRVAVALTYKF